MFEMAKANVAGTGASSFLSCLLQFYSPESVGYKLRTSIWKHLKSRSTAIKSAFTTYNRLAKKMDPPAPHLTWKDVVDLAFVADFDLLRDQYSLPVDALPDRPWMKPGYREVANRYFKIVRAREELTRVYVKVARLRNWIDVEDDLYSSTIKRLRAEGDLPLAQAVEEQWRRRAKVNQNHEDLLDELEALPEFQGVRGAGAVRRSPANPAPPTPATAVPVPANALDLQEELREANRLDVPGDREEDVEALANALEDR
jgi:hypothetical protein